MSIKSIRIKNLLSFDDFMIKDFKDINCIIGRNNVGKSNVIKLIDFYYKSLIGESYHTLKLHDNYSNHGEITIVYDTSRLESVIRTNRERSSYQRHIYKTMFKSELSQWSDSINKGEKKEYFSLTLKLHKNNSISWSDSDKNVREIIHRIYPFFSIDTRRLDLYNWQYLWGVVTKLKFLNTKTLSREKIVNFIDNNVSKKSNSYKDYVDAINSITKTLPYNYQEKLLSYIRVGLEGQTFNINGLDLDTQSDGTNSHRFLEIFLNLIITLTRREFITPTIFIDEPELGMHPMKCEELIYNLSNIYRRFKSESPKWEKGKYKTPYPTIIFTTHSPSILKTVVKQFNQIDEHKVFHFTSTRNGNTVCSTMNSYFDDNRFVNVFNDNEARLFFSNFILFVEGETELELFGNLSFKSIFPILNRVDIYKTNEVMLNAIKPSNSNVHIPYLILYDADKMLSINTSNGSIDFLSKEVNLHEITSKYKKSVWGSKNFNYYKRLNSILRIDGVKNDFNNNKTSFINFKVDSFIERINNIITKSERIKVAPTTIEGYLINKNSFKIFIKWIIYEFYDNVSVGIKGDPNRVIDSWRAKNIDSGNLTRCFNTLFNGSKVVHDISGENLIFIELVKLKYIKKVFSEIVKSKLSQEDKLILARVLFEGKSDTLCSKDNKNYTRFIDKSFRDLVTSVKESLIDKLPFGGSKTGGWVSKFLDFSIAELKQSSMNKSELEYNFKSAFPELCSIIEEVSSSID